MNIKIDLNINAPEWSNIVQAIISVIPNAIPNSVGSIKLTNIGSQIIESKTIQTSEEEPSSTLTTTIITLEEVRAKLAQLSQSGKQVQVKALITKFGGSKLTEISVEHYGSLLKEAEVL